MTDPDTATFGRRFLDEYVRLGGLLSSFQYEEIQALRRAGREEMIELLRRTQPMSINYAAIQRIRRIESPEALARRMYEEVQQAARPAVVPTLFGLICTLISGSSS